MLGGAVIDAKTVVPPPGTGTGTAGTGPKTLVVIPVYNHVQTVSEVAQRALDQGFPVLVLDDGSTDGSLDAVALLPVGRHRLPVNAGKGGAILAAAELAQGWGYEAILTIDADGQHDPADANLLMKAASRTWPAIVIGARRMATDNVPRSSLFGRDFSNFWVRLESGQTLPDTQSGYRLYPVEFLQRSRFLTRRYTFEIEVLVRGRWAGLPVLSVPVSVYYPPGDERVSHFHQFKDNLRLTCLHTYLVTRSLVPWPHRKLFSDPVDGQKLPSIFQPVTYFRALSREHSSAGELGAAVGAGIFLGALPIIPFGIAVIVYTSHKLHLNKLAAVGASNVCCAPFVPFLCVELGHYLLYGQFWYEFNRHTLLEQLHLRLWEWLIGSLLIGPVLGTIGGALAYILIRSYRRRRGGSSDPDATEQKAELR
jgi:glycosyltransferase involved in cell wall biosynthesis